jgi:hypothetical protein
VPARRDASRKAIAIASSTPARATISHSDGATESPSSENGVVTITGSGFHDGPPTVSRSKCVIWRPHSSHAHGS